MTNKEPNNKIEDLLKEYFTEYFIASEEEQTHNAFPYNLTPETHEAVMSQATQALHQSRQEALEEVLGVIENFNTFGSDYAKPDLIKAINKLKI